MRNNVVISGSSGWGDWCSLNDAAYESILVDNIYCSYFCSSELCTRRHKEVRVSATSGWATLRRMQWQQWHVLRADLLLNLCTLINLSTVPARASPPSEERHLPQWPVNYVWLWFWCKLCKDFPSETLNLFCHIRECVSLAHSFEPSVSVSVGWEFEIWKALDMAGRDRFHWKCSSLVQTHLCFIQNKYFQCLFNISIY